MEASQHFWENNRFAWMISLTIFRGVVVTPALAAIPQPLLPENPQTPHLVASVSCNFSQPASLRQTRRYSMLGDDEFDTLVCGYLVIKNEEVLGEPTTSAYLRIIKFFDPKFKLAMEQAVKSGNTVNIVENGVYDFNLGCFQNRQIVGMEYDPKQSYLTPEVEARIIASSAQKPVALILSFGKHTGTGCDCCNTAHRIRLYP